RELVGDVGDTVAVPVTLHTMNDVDAFGLDLGFPTVLLSYVRLDPGILTPGPCWNIGGNYLSALNAVRLGGSCLTPLPSGSVGTVAIVHFEIIAAGSGDFSSGGYVDDIAGYTPCESVHSTTDIDQDSWGRVKSLYQGR
ncbi:MAG: hypothetical protein HKN12_10340, partial [Gemmatimonadetes bacterium]|nr:hypothetical protein [Gemmatimonadota bacterium]